MAGVLVPINTLVAGINLNVKRLLQMGNVVTLGLYVPDAQAPSGMTPIRTYVEAFCRIPELEEENGDGRTVVFDIADVFPVGQLAGDLAQPQLYVKYTADGVDSEFFRVNDAPAPAPEAAQIRRLTCQTRTAKQTYFRVGRRAGR